MSAFRSEGERMVWAAKFAQFSADSEFHQRIACVAVLALRGESPSSDVIDDLAAAMLAEMRGEGGIGEVFRETLETAAENNAALRARVEELEAECSALAADQCHDGYAGEHGHHRCREVDRLRAALEAVAWFEAPGLNGARWCCRGCGGETRTPSTDACTPNCIVGQALGR